METHILLNWFLLLLLNILNELRYRVYSAFLIFIIFLVGINSAMKVIRIMMIYPFIKLNLVYNFGILQFRFMKKKFFLHNFRWFISNNYTLFELLKRRYLTLLSKKNELDDLLYYPSSLISLVNWLLISSVGTLSSLIISGLLIYFILS